MNPSLHTNDELNLKFFHKKKVRIQFKMKFKREDQIKQQVFFLLNFLEIERKQLSHLVNQYIFFI